MQPVKKTLIAASLGILLALASLSHSDSPETDGDAQSAVASRVLEKLRQRGLVNEEEVTSLNRELEAADSQTSEQLFSNIDTIGGADDHMPEAILAVIAIIGLFSAPVLIVWLVSISNYRRRKLLHDNINKLIEQGGDLPPELLNHLRSTPKNRDNLEKGMKYIALGLGVSISLSIIGDLAVGSLGLIPLFLGLAHLLIWKLDQLKTDPGR